MYCLLCCWECKRQLVFWRCRLLLTICILVSRYTKRSMNFDCILSWDITSLAMKSASARFVIVPITLQRIDIYAMLCWVIRDVVSVLNVSVLRVQRLGLLSVLRVWKNGTSRSHLGLEGWPSRSCDLTSCGHPWYKFIRAVQERLWSAHSLWAVVCLPSYNNT